MCGFAGVWGGDHTDENHVGRMVAAIRHRGPDDNGVWCDPGCAVGLGLARLAILDLSPAGHQPMISLSGRYVIAYNGEIYNYRSLREELTGARFNGPGETVAWRGHSDTETLLAGFDVWGIRATVERTVGMFGFAVWDRHDRSLTLGRDRLGEKPVYYGWQDKSLLFGSELKALKANPSFTPDIDRDALTEFMRYGYVPAPKSIYRGINKLLPGTLLTVTGAGAAESKSVRYWSLVDVARAGLASPFTGSDGEAIDGLETRLSEAVALQQVADVPLGAFLSGGIDSSTVVALMQAQSKRPIHTFTIGFDDAQYDEAAHAAAVARHLGTDHTALYVTPDEARSVIQRLPELYDEPFADSSQIPTYLVSRLARRHVTVSLSGDAGDELFGGYNRYAWTRRVLKYPAPVRRMFGRGLRALSPGQWNAVHGAVRPLLPRGLRVRMPGDKAHKLASVLTADSDAAVYQRLISSWPDPETVVLNGRESGAIASAWSELDDFPTPEARMMALDAVTYLPDDILCKMDRAAMGVSLETRVPFLDHRVVEFAWRLPLSMKIRDGQGKWILRQLLDKHVPRALIERPKMGFGVPIDSWLRGPLRNWAEGLLDESRLRAEGFLNPVLVRRRWVEHLSGRRNWHYQLWNALMFQAWLEAERRPGH